MLEGELQAQVLELATMLGCLTYHTYDSRRSREGFPDLVVVHERTGGLIFAELKRDGKHPTAAQQRWLDALGRRHEVHVWTPFLLRSGVIGHQLQALGRVGS
jgi:hypothetical protein